MANFNLNDLAMNINQIFEEDMKVTKADLQYPKADFIKRIVYQFLLEFDHSDFMGQSHKFELNGGNLSDDLADTVNLDILVVATRKFFQQIEGKT